MLNKLLKNKSVGYYLACAAAVLALIFVIIFFATLGTAGTDSYSMPNSAVAKTPETIGIFMIGGFVVQLAFLVFPEFGFIQIIALVLFGFSFYKELLCCPQVLAAIVTGVAYEGGSLPAHLTYIILEVLIFVLAIVGSFMGHFKNDEEAVEDMKFKTGNGLNVTNTVKAGSALVLVIAAVLASSLTSNAMEAATAGKGGSTETPKVNPITDEMKEIAEAYEYDFNPAEVHFTKEDIPTNSSGYDMSSTTSLPTNGNRPDYNLVYKFEGSYAEGWQGDYSKTYAYLYLWEDGRFAGTSGSTQFRGFWYDNGDASTLVMVTGNGSDGEIIAYEAKGFYSWIVDLNSSVNGGRRIKANGYLYYPEVTLFIDTADSDLSNVKAGSTVDVSGWTAQRVLKNLKYSSCYENNSSKVSWKVNGNNINNGIVSCPDAGEYVVTATWKTDRNETLEASVTITAKAAEEAAE